jgi:hypothetical protein
MVPEPYMSRENRLKQITHSLRY